MVFDRYPGSGGELLLALALADHSHDDGTRIFPSIAYLAKKTRQSERSVQYQLRRMETTGWLLLVNSGLGGRRRGSNDAGVTREYRINPGWLKGEKFSPFEKEAVEHSPDSGSDGGDPNNGADSAPLNGDEKGAKRAVKGCKTARLRVQKDAFKGARAIAPEPKATKSNQEQPSQRECEREADPDALTAEQVDVELSGFGSIPVGVDRELLARFRRHRQACRRPLSVQGWMQVRAALAELLANGHDPNESLKQTMAAGLSLPVIPVSTTTAGATDAIPQHGSADHVEALHQQFERHRRGSGHAGSACGGPAEYVDADFRVVG